MQNENACQNVCIIKDFNMTFIKCDFYKMQETKGRCIFKSCLRSKYYQK